ncbi:Uncharacterized protein Adt_00300 [Abeliophyllum distichum]|uniref:Uncharacterized protein n=1 Tax=Abeliophyllum distichum TaxID=126358 RepID=A0ABD1VPN9_9LAMI
MTDATNAQLATLTKQVELLVRTQTQGINAIQTTIMCENCGANHSTSDCMLLASSEQVNFVLNDTHQQYNPYSQTYNSSWKQHPNFKWYENKQFGNIYNAQQERGPSLEEMFQQFMQKTDKVLERLDTNYQNQHASIRKIEIQIGAGYNCQKIHVKRPEKNDEQLTIEEEEVGKQDEKSKEEEYVEKEKLILNEQNKKMTFNDTALIKQSSESRIYSQIDFADQGRRGS